MKLSIKQASTIYGSRFINGSRNNIKSINLFLSILTPYFLDLKRKIAIIGTILQSIAALYSKSTLSNEPKKPHPVIPKIAIPNASKNISFCIRFKSSRTLKNFLQSHIQLFHHRFIVSINKFTILS